MIINLKKKLLELKKSGINKVTCDSKRSDKKTLFIALKGHQYDGNNFVKDLKGPYLSSKFCSRNYVFNLKSKLRLIYETIYNIDLTDYINIGVTGTSGKSSLSSYLNQVLNDFNLNSYVFSNVIQDNYLLSELTTPNYETVFNHLKSLEENKKEVNVLLYEVSSIGIEEKRLFKLPWDYLFLTNLHQDHLDYHNTLHKYYKAKSKLFRSNRKAKAFTFPINLNTKELKKMKNRFTVVNDYKAEKNKAVIDKMSYKTNLPTVFQNELICLLLIFLDELNLSYYDKKLAVSRIKSLKGRFDIVNENPTVIIDYAHEPFSMDTVINEANKMCKGKLYIIFGAGGNRDKLKRKMYQQVALKYDGVKIVTEDNPRNEDLKSIISDIVDGYEKDFVIIENREKAIIYALQNANKKDLVLILGKGHEEYIYKNGAQIPYSDYEVIKQWQSNLKSI